VRALLSILEQKGHLLHKEDGSKYIYLPARPREKERRSALGRVVSTFFAGPLGDTIVRLAELAESEPSKEDLERINQLIDQARKEGR
jgi:predicted transcriptional regulator